MIKRKGYRGVLPKARNKAQAERVETQIRQDIYNQKYTQTIAPNFGTFVQEMYLPWAKLNNHSWCSDVEQVANLTQVFGTKRLDKITPALVEKFKRQRRESITRRGRQRTPASVNWELEVLSCIFIR